MPKQGTGIKQGGTTAFDKHELGECGLIKLLW